MSTVVVVLLFLTFPGVGRDQPEGRYQESTLSGHAVLSPTVVLLSLCVCVCVLVLSASMSVCERVRVWACPWSLGRMALGVSAGWPLDSRRMAWPHLCTLGRGLR